MKLRALNHTKDSVFLPNLLWLSSTQAAVFFIVLVVLLQGDRVDAPTLAELKVWLNYEQLNKCERQRAESVVQYLACTYLPARPAGNSLDSLTSSTSGRPLR